MSTLLLFPARQKKLLEGLQNLLTLMVIHFGSFLLFLSYIFFLTRFRPLLKKIEVEAPDIH